MSLPYSGAPADPHQRVKDVGDAPPRLVYTEGETEVVVGIKEVPETIKYPPPKNLGSKIAQPGLPRATEAVSQETPRRKGRPQNMTVMQQHVEYFDFDKDGIIYPWDTFCGFWRLGYNIFICIVAPFLIHVPFFYATQPYWLPNPVMPIYVANVHKLKHGSDSETYDNEGRYVPEKFEEIFSKFDRENKGGLTLREMFRMTENNKNAYDFFGWTADKLEWLATYLLCRNEMGLVPKERILGVFDGSLFHELDKEYEDKQVKKKQARERARQAKEAAKEAAKREKGGGKKVQ